MIEAGSLIRSLSGRPAARNFHTFVINEIGHGIVTGLFPVGSILASDAVMMETYGVSRTVLREALKTLEAKGLVEARPKVGTRVSPPSRWNFFDPQVLAWHYYRKPDPHFYENLFSVRGALELEASREAVRHRTAEHVRLMKYWLHQMSSAPDNIEQFGLACLEVHRIMAECSDNVLLRSVTGVVELTLALALTADQAASGAAYRAAAIGERERMVASIEKGQAGENAAAVSAALALDRVQALKAV
jgi:DNA-binding FadR family transcriptional regulator